ncbi:MAG: Hpt domain-containing protein [Oligoflexia bacterium]|nr:Hpt domain-containing protein [Oligoflexia bacterium]
MGELEDFQNEAAELLDQAERSLLAVDSGEDFSKHYDIIFRVLHNLKGSAAMLTLTEAERHLHQVETLFQQSKGTKAIGREVINFFLNSIDATRILLAGKTVNFSYDLKDNSIMNTAINPLPVEQKTLLGLKICMVARESHMTFVDGIRSQGCNVICRNNFADIIKGNYLTEMDLFILVSDSFDEHVKIMADHVKGKNIFMPMILATACQAKVTVEQGQQAGFHLVITFDSRCSRTISLLGFAAKCGKLWRMINNALTLLLYRHVDFDAFLLANEKAEIHKTLNANLTEILQTIASTGVPIEMQALARHSSSGQQGS